MSESQIELSLDEEIEMSKARTAELVERKNKELIEKRAAALAPVLAAIKAHNFTAAELGMICGANATKAEAYKLKKSEQRTAIEPKYRDPASGATWVGRGKTPAWMSAQLADGKVKEDFLIVKPSAPAEPVGAGELPAAAQPGASGQTENQEFGLAA